LKAGICIAALGAMEKYGKTVTLVPCGMSYENQHIFRSKMTVEFGEPFQIPHSMIEQYRKNKSSVIAALLEST
jgi:glycerol-3-phosphate O-acyltransferase/dihydroxyacetone phosphate acyltransferase